MTTQLRTTRARALGIALLASSLPLAAGCSSAPGGGAEDVDTERSTLNANDKTAFDFFVARGLTKIQSAGIVGNLQQESGMDPTIAQYGGGPGRGIAQWSVGDRWDRAHDDNVAWYAGTKGMSEYSLTLQLEFVWYELETFSDYGLAKLRAASTVSEATYAFQNDYERCGTCDESNRLAYANQALAAYGGGSGGGGGCTVGGLYCGGDKVSGSSGTLYRCTGGSSGSVVEVCSNGCQVNSGTDDACKAGGSTGSGGCIAGGLYCGGDKVSGNANTLYRCTGGSAGTALGTCSDGCAVVSGSNDECRGAGGCVVGGLYCGGDKVSGDPSVLYRCTGGASGSVVERCSNGCSVSSGRDDACR
jgi:hypothetical protein